MSLDFQRQRLMSNISYMIKQRSLKIGDIEAEIGISNGYLAKLLKKDTDAAPSVETVWKLAKVLGVSTDTLIEGDLSMSLDNVQYIANFLIRLRDFTNTNRLDWEKISLAAIDAALDDYTPKFPIVSGGKNGDGYRSLKKILKPKTVKCRTESRDNYFCSAGIDVLPVWPLMPAYRAQINDNTYVHVFYMGCPIQLDNGECDTVDYYDIYMEYEVPGAFHSELTFEPVCNTFNNARDILDIVSDLYQTIKKHEPDLKISNELRETISQFMNPKKRDVTKGPENVLYDTGDIPF